MSIAERSRYVLRQVLDQHDGDERLSSSRSEKDNCVVFDRRVQQLQLVWARFYVRFFSRTM